MKKPRTLAQIIDAIGEFTHPAPEKLARHAHLAFVWLDYTESGQLRLQATDLHRLVCYTSKRFFDGRARAVDDRADHEIALEPGGYSPALFRKRSAIMAIDAIAPDERARPELHFERMMKAAKDDRGHKGEPAPRHTMSFNPNLFGSMLLAMSKLTNDKHGSINVRTAMSDVSPVLVSFTDDDGHADAVIMPMKI